MAGKKETAEKIMITNFPVISENLQINELEKVLIKKQKILNLLTTSIL